MTDWYATKISSEYFDWMRHKIGHFMSTSRLRLLKRLNEIPYRYHNESDFNRYMDALNLRDTFAYENQLDRDCIYISGPPSVLEMLVSFAIRTEELLSDEEAYGVDRTGFWFDTFLYNIGILDKTDLKMDNDPESVDIAIDNFLDHKYEPNGKGGLFVINDGTDIRNLGLWEQLNKYCATNLKMNEE